MSEDFHPLRFRTLGAEPTISSPISIHRQFAIYVLQCERDMRLVSEPHQVECWIADIDFPVLDRGRSAAALQALIRIASRRVPAPQSCASPTCLFDRMIQLYKSVFECAC